MLTIEPRPAGPTFARCALQGAHAGPNDLPMDTKIYIYQRIAPANSCNRLASLAINFVPIGRPFGPAWAPCNAQRANVGPAGSGSMVNIIALKTATLVLSRS